jgi:hypothetical protein
MMTGYNYRHHVPHSNADAQSIQELRLLIIEWLFRDLRGYYPSLQLRVMKIMRRLAKVGKEGKRRDYLQKSPKKQKK